MDARVEFIPGIFNYCDQWCSACPFTARCRSFAMEAEIEAHNDPHMRALVELHRDREDRDRPAWMQQVIEEAERLVERGEIANVDPQPSAESHKPLEWRAEAYSDNAQRWLNAQGVGHSEDPSDPLAVVAWFASYIPSKLRRATVGIANDDGELSEFPSDADGSAKAALVAIQRSHAAWSALSGAGILAPALAEHLIGDLFWLEAEIDRQFPNARAFVRPGFDAPEAVAPLEAGE